MPGSLFQGGRHCSEASRTSVLDDLIPAYSLGSRLHGEDRGVCLGERFWRAGLALQVNAIRHQPPLQRRSGFPKGWNRSRWGSFGTTCPNLAWSSSCGRPRSLPAAGLLIPRRSAEGAVPPSFLLPHERPVGGSGEGGAKPGRRLPVSQPGGAQGEQRGRRQPREASCSSDRREFPAPSPRQRTDQAAERRSPPSAREHRRGPRHGGRDATGETRKLRQEGERAAPSSLQLGGGGAQQPPRDVGSRNLELGGARTAGPAHRLQALPGLPARRGLPGFGLAPPLRGVTSRTRTV